MNKSVYTKISKSLLIPLWLLASSCQPAAPTAAPAVATEAPAASAETEAAAPAPVSEGAPTIHMKVIQYDLMASDDQVSRINEAAGRIGSDMGIAIDIEVLPLAANPDSCSAAYLITPNGSDLYMQDSVCSSHALEANTYAFVPQELAAELKFFSPGLYAFSDQSGNLWAAPFGTSPMMIIYNPDILGELPAAPNLSEMMELSAAYPLTIPPHGAIAMAIVQSYLTDPFQETDLLVPGFYDQLGGLVDIIDKMAANGQIRSASTQEILQGFMNGEIPWTVQDVMFLRMLKMNGYDGPVAVAGMPQINRMGGSAMSIAWVVPKDSKNQEIAWKVVSMFANDPQVIQWLIGNGFLPFYESGFAQLEQQHALADPWLPSQLLENAQNLKVLRMSAQESTAWSLPASVPADTYNQIILPRSTELIGNIANGQVTMKDSLETWRKLLAEVGIQR